MIVLKTQAFAARDLTTANGITILTSDAMPGSPAIHNVGAVIRIGSGEGGANDLHADARILSLWLLLDGVPASRFDFTPRLDTPEVQDVISMPPFPVLAGQVATLKLFSSNANDTAVKVAADLGSHDIDHFHAQVVPAVNVAQINSSALAAQVLAAEKYEYKDDAVVVVADGATDAARGVNLATAYTAAKALTPGGNALSTTNRACVLIPPARYSLAATLVADGEFVDFVGLGSQPEDVEVYADLETATVQQTADDVRMRNFVLRTLNADGRDLEINATNNAPSTYEDMRFRHPDGAFGVFPGVYGVSHIRGTWRRCKADAWSWRLAENKGLEATMYDCEAGDNSFGGDAVGAYISGRFERCIALGDYSFGGCTNFGCNISGTLIDCEAGDYSFAVGKSFSGKAIRCRGGTHCFGSTTHATYPGTFSGYAEDCAAKGGSFGGRALGIGAYGMCAGTLVRCVIRWNYVGLRLYMATLEGCFLSMWETNQDGIVLLDSLSRITDSTILVIEGGTGVPINDDGSARSVAAAGNRFNNLSAASLGLGPNVTNLGLLDKIDATVASRLAAAWATGITSAAAWLRGLFRKSAMDATAKGEVNAGGGTFNEATDSEEALGEKTTAVKAKTDTIGAAELTAVSPVLEDGDLEIVQSDDYMDADGRALEWTDTAYTGPIQDGDDAEFALMETADYHAAGGTPALTKAGTAHLVGTTLRIVVELTAAETAALEPSPPDDRMNYTYQVRVDIGSSGSGERQVTAALGSATVKKKVVA